MIVKQLSVLRLGRRIYRSTDTFLQPATDNHAFFMIHTFRNNMKWQVDLTSHRYVTEEKHSLFKDSRLINYMMSTSVPKLFIPDRCLLFLLNPMILSYFG